MYRKLAALVLAAALLCSCSARVTVQRYPAELPRAESPAATPTPEPVPTFTEEQKAYGSAAAIGGKGAGLFQREAAVLFQQHGAARQIFAQRFDVAQLIIGHCSGIFHGKHPPFSLVYKKYPQAGEGTFRVLR